MKFLREKSGSFLFPAILVLICLIILLRAYVPGTWLSGWDTLHPEFNFFLNFKRLIFGVFRSEQGLGAVAAHSHMSDLPRVIFLWLSSVLLPINLLRFFYIALCLPIGVLGVFFFIKNIVLENVKVEIKKYFAFLGALFYLFNLGTLQHFYVPFEMFTTAYAFLPWLFLQAANFLKKNSKKNLFIFAILSLISSPMAYAALLWYSYFLSLLLFLLIFGKKHYGQVAALLLVALLVNSFWILPNLYFLFSGNASQVPLAKINKIFSDEAYFYNKSFGNIKDILIFKNFLFEWPVYSGNNRFDYLLGVWRNHIGNPIILSLGYLLSAVSVLGFVQQFIKGGYKNSISKALILPTITCLIFLINASFPFDFLFSYFRENFLVFREAFRFPFTKFSNVLIFTFSVFFSLGSLYIYTLVIKIKRIKDFPKPALKIQIFITSLLLVIFMLPYFQGEIISPKMFISIPNEYFETFKFLNSQDENSRVAFFPVHSFWGWIYYDFGFQGAQFVTFGIKQPVMDRDFDRWNPANEEYFRQMSYAVYSQNPQLLKKILEKYKVGYLVVDRNIIAPDTNQYFENLYLSQIDLLLKNTDYLELEKKYNNIAIYKFTDLNNSKIESPLKYTDLSKNYGLQEIDWAYLNQGDYIQREGGGDSLEYPLLTLQDNQNFLDTGTIKVKENQLKLDTKNINNQLTLSLRDLLKSEIFIPVDIYTKVEGAELVIKFKVAAPNLENSDTNIEKRIPFHQIGNNKDLLLNIDKYQTVKLKNIDSADYIYQGSALIGTTVFTNVTLINPENLSPSPKEITDNFSINTRNKSNFVLSLCNKPDQDQVFSVGVTDDKSIKIAAKNSKACVWIPLKNVIDSQSLSNFRNLVGFKFQTKSKKGVIGKFCIFDKSLERCVKEKKYLTADSLIEDYFSISESDLERLELVLSLDGLNNKDLEEIIYSNFAVLVSQPSVTFSISPEELEQVMGNKKISLNEGEFSVGYPQNLSLEKFNLLESGHEKGECSNLETKDFDRKINQANGYIEYSSIKGSSCDHFTFPALDHNLGYFIVIESKNLKGLPLRMCAANPYSKRCDVYLSLPYNRNFEKNIVMVPPLSDGGVGYDIHFDNYAVGNIASVNQVRALEIMPFPYFWLKSQFTEDEGSLTNSKLVVQNYNEYLPGIIKVNYLKPEAGTGLLVLNQVYERGWLGGNYKHVKVNGWANGWLVNNNSDSIWFIYWPQFLQYLGFINILLVFWWLADFKLSFKFRNLFYRNE